MTTLGQAVRELREERGMSMSKLSRAADLSMPVITRVESDGGNVTLFTIEKIAGVFGMTAGELMAMTDEREREGR